LDQTGVRVCVYKPHESHRIPRTPQRISLTALPQSFREIQIQQEETFKARLARFPNLCWVLLFLIEGSEFREGGRR
jgi:hypothetical protein